MAVTIQVINWYPEWQGFKFHRTNPKTDKNAGYYLIYRWFILIGFWEIRKFMTGDEMNRALKIHQDGSKGT